MTARPITPCVKYELDAQHRVEGEEDARIVDEVDQAAHGEHDEPHEHDGPEELRHLGRAARLRRRTAARGWRP